MRAKGLAMTAWSAAPAARSSSVAHAVTVRIIARARCRWVVARQHDGDQLDDWPVRVDVGGAPMKAHAMTCAHRGVES